jgi:hypothetical protein
MAQNPYLQNLLGINQGGMGLYNYNYSLPNYNTLLSQGLTEDQIKGYDTGFNTFNQFPYQAQPNPQLNYPQYGVVPQAPDVAPINPPSTPEEQVTIDYSQQQDIGPSFQEEQQMKIKEDFPLGQGYAKTMSEFDEPMMMEWARDKGYIDDYDFLAGPMQTNVPKFSLMGQALTGPMQAMNDRAYNNWLDQARRMGMISEFGTPGGTKGRFRISEKFKLKDSIAERMNTSSGVSSNKDELGKRKYINTYAPNISNSDEIVYYTKGGGRYTKDGFVTGDNQSARHGSMNDITQSLQAAADLYNKTGDLSGFESIPDKFLTKEYKNKIVGGADHLNDYKGVISSAITTYQGAGGKKVGKGSGGPGPKERSKLKPKQKDTKKDYGPKSTAESTRAIKDKLESGKSVGGGDSVSRFKAQERARSKPAFLS